MLHEATTLDSRNNLDWSKKNSNGSANRSASNSKGLEGNSNRTSRMRNEKTTRMEIQIIFSDGGEENQKRKRLLCVIQIRWKQIAPEIINKSEDVKPKRPRKRSEYIDESKKVTRSGNQEIHLSRWGDKVKKTRSEQIS